MPNSTMSCEEVLKHLLAYLDREADARVTAEIERHLDECRACFSRAEFERRLKTSVREAGSSAAPERLRARIKALIEKF